MKMTNFARIRAYTATAALSAVGVLGVVPFAAAIDIDVTDVVATITGGVTTVSAIGVAVLSLVVTVKLFKWARSAM